MNWGYVISYPIYIGIALGAALMIVVMLGGAVSFASRFERYVFPVIFLCLIVDGSVSTLLSDRDLNSLGFIGVHSDGERGGLLGRIAHWGLTIGALTLCGALIINYLLARNREAIGVAKPYLLGFVAFFFTNVVTSSLFGTLPAFSHNYLYPLPVFLALCIGSLKNPLLIEKYIKTLLFGYLVVGLALAVALPKIAVQTGYAGLVPGFNIRLYGLAPHANVLAPVALVILLMEFQRPYAGRFWHRLTLIVAMAVLVLAQSKTTWVAALVAGTVLFLARPRSGIVHSLQGAMQGSAMIRVFPILGLLTLFAGGVALILFWEPEALWYRFMLTDAGTTVESMSGRMIIWQAAISEWLRNPAFGYGPTMWDLTYRVSMGLYSAFHAHNLFLQSLSTAGLLGLGGLLVYLWILGRGAWHTRTASRGVTLAMFAILLFRAITEVPLPTQSITSPDFLVHLALVISILNGFRPAPAVAATRATPQPGSMARAGYRRLPSEAPLS